jgi:CNT family concentrative nucleoside transporter
MEKLMSVIGIFAMLGFAWAWSTDRRAINMRIVVGGLLLQFVLALLILKTGPGEFLFQWLGDSFTNILKFSEEGSDFVFNSYPDPDNAQEAESYPPIDVVARTLAFRVLPTIIFFSALMSVLYHVGIIQVIVRAMATVMQKTLKTSGAETLAAASNVFIGQTEAPLVIRPYLLKMTKSELMSMMVGGFATIAGGVLVVYVTQMKINAGHLMTASVISAPAALLLAKILVPETETPETSGDSIPDIPKTSSNVIEAATIGASDGLKLALNVGAMLIAFTALIALVNGIFVWAGETLFELTGSIGQGWSLGAVLGYLFYPFAFLLGIQPDECLQAGELLGLKMAANEYIAFDKLGKWMANPDKQLSERTYIILTYALAGFANFASIGIQIGGIGGLVPERRKDLAMLGFKAMIGGTLACFMTACIAGVLIAGPVEEPSEPDSKQEETACLDVTVNTINEKTIRPSNLVYKNLDKMRKPRQSQLPLPLLNTRSKLLGIRSKVVLVSLDDAHPCC